LGEIWPNWVTAIHPAHFQRVTIGALVLRNGYRSDEM
jgi:hypothetical protein